MIKLECPCCNYTLTAEQWNENVKDSVNLGVCDELIPLDLSPEDWEDYYNEHGGRCDCPECNETVSFCDMAAY